jgi:dolichol-phosphate mannosyltransferase
MPRLLLAARDGRLPMLTSPDTSRDFVYVDDVIDAFIRAAHHASETPGAIYNIGSGTEVSLRELVQLTRELFDVRAEPRWGSMADRSWDTETWIADSNHANQELGWHAGTGLEAGMGAFAKWLGPFERRYREHGMLPA